LYCGFHDKGIIYIFLDLDLEFDVQGWSYWNRVVPSITSFYPSIYSSWFSNAVSKEEQEGWILQ
jgi:hypothetical protein